MPKIISIIGLGLIGGSIAMDLKKKKFASEFIGVDNSLAHQNEALNLGIVDKITSLEEAIASSDLIILATPVDACLRLLPKILDLLPEGKTVMDVGSTKSALIEKIKNHPKRKFYVPTHPMSGTEFSGPKAALLGLFEKRVAIICNREDSDPSSIRLISDLYLHLGTRLVFMDSEAHDEHVGYISHLSHVISYVLAVSVLEKEKTDNSIFNLAAGGFSSTVRLAKSSVDMWLPIFEQNAQYILPIIEIYQEKLEEFRSYLAHGESEKLANFIKQANKIKEKME